MRIQVKVVTGASFDRIEKINKGQYKLKTTKKPIRGEANKAVIDLLARYFGVSKSEISIIAGKTCSQKMIEILDDQF